MTHRLDEQLAADIEQSAQGYRELVIRQIGKEIPDLFKDPELLALGESGAQALLEQFVVVLRLGLPQELHAPTQCLLFAQMLARAGVSLDKVLRSYRLGQEITFDRAAALAQAEASADYGDFLRHISSLSFRFLDAILADVTAEFEQERESKLQRSFARRDQTIHALLAGIAIDFEQSELTLGRRLGGAHQAAVAFASHAPTLDAAEIATRLQEAIASSGQKALVLTEQRTATAWTDPPPEHPGSTFWRDVSKPLAQSGVLLAVGEDGVGPTGFVRTKHQADLACDVARLCPPQPLTNYSQVALAAVLTRDLAVGQAFMHDELGRLADPTEAAALLRATLAAFYATGHEQSRTAARLQLHRNTVARRLSRAEEVLGHRLDTRVGEVQAALVLAEILQRQKFAGR